MSEGKADTVEYEQALLSYRFFHEYRMRALNFCIALNAAMIYAVVQHVKVTAGQVALSMLAMVATAAFLGLELRSINLAGQLWGRIRELEAQLGYCAMSKVWQFSMSGIPQRYFIRAIYGAILLVWAYVMSASALGVI